MTQQRQPTGQNTRRAASHSSTSADREQLMRAKLALVAAREQLRATPASARQSTREGDAGVLAHVMTSYPQQALELIDFSATLVATESYEHEAAAPEVDDIAARARARVLTALFPAQQPMPATTLGTMAQGAIASLKELRKARRMSAVALAGRLGLGVDVLSDLEAGLIRVATIPERFIRSLGEALNASAEQISNSLQMQSVALPALRRDRAGASKDAPTEPTRAFADAVRQSPNMTAAQKIHWTEA